jgi:hypothetical protein
MTIDDSGERVGQVGLRIAALVLYISMSEAMVAQFSAPASCPAKRVF